MSYKEGRSLLPDRTREPKLRVRDDGAERSPVDEFANPLRRQGTTKGATGQRVTIDLQHKGEDSSKLRSAQQKQTRGSLHRGRSKATKGGGVEDTNEYLPGQGLQGAGVVLPNIQQPGGALEQEINPPKQANSTEQTPKSNQFYLPSLQRVGRQGSFKPSPNDLQLEIMGQDVQGPSQNQTSKNKQKKSHQYQPLLQSFKEDEECYPQMLHQHVEMNLRKVLMCHSIGIPLEITQPQFVRMRHARPVFHCKRCLDHWAQVGALPKLCELPGEDVFGPVIELSSRAAQFLKSVWNSKDLKNDKEVIFNFRENLNFLLEGEGKGIRKHSSFDKEEFEQTSNRAIGGIRKEHKKKVDSFNGYYSDSEYDENAAENGNSRRSYQGKHRRHRKNKMSKDERKGSERDHGRSADPNGSYDYFDLSPYSGSSYESDEEVPRPSPRREHQSRSRHRTRLDHEKKHLGPREGKKKREKSGRSHHKAHHRKGRRLMRHPESNTGYYEYDSTNESDLENGSIESDSSMDYTDREKGGKKYRKKGKGSKRSHRHKGNSHSTNSHHTQGKRGRKKDMHRDRSNDVEDNGSSFSMTDSVNYLKHPDDKSSVASMISPKHYHPKDKKHRKHSRRSKKHSHIRHANQRHQEAGNQETNELASHSRTKGGRHYHGETYDTESSYDTDTESLYSSSDDNIRSSHAHINRPYRKNRKSKKKQHSDDADDKIYDKYAKSKKNKAAGHLSRGEAFHSESPGHFVLPGRTNGGDLVETLLDELLNESTDYKEDYRSSMAYPETEKLHVFVPHGINAGDEEILPEPDKSYGSSSQQETGKNVSPGRKQEDNIEKTNPANSSIEPPSQQSQKHYSEVESTGLGCWNPLSGSDLTRQSSHGIRNGIAYDVMSAANTPAVDSHRGGLRKRRQSEKPIIRNPLAKNKTGKPDTEPGMLKRNKMATPLNKAQNRGGSHAVERGKVNHSGADGVGTGQDTVAGDLNDQKSTSNKRSQLNSEPVAAMQNFNIDELPDLPPAHNESQGVRRQSVVKKKDAQTSGRRVSKAYHSTDMGDMKTKVEMDNQGNDIKRWRSKALPELTEEKERQKTSNKMKMKQGQTAPPLGLTNNTDKEFKTTIKDARLAVETGDQGEKSTCPVLGEVLVGKNTSLASVESKTAKISSPSSSSCSEKADLMSLSEIFKERTRFILPNIDGISVLSFTPAFTFSMYGDPPPQYKERNETVKAGKSCLEKTSKSVKKKSTKENKKLHPKKNRSISKLAKKMLNKVSNPTPIAKYVKKLDPLAKQAPKTDGSGDNEPQNNIIEKLSDVNIDSDIEDDKSLVCQQDSIQSKSVVFEEVISDNENIDWDASGTPERRSEVFQTPEVLGMKLQGLFGAESVVINVQEYSHQMLS